MADPSGWARDSETLTAVNEAAKKVFDILILTWWAGFKASWRDYLQWRRLID